jgi:bidirectional [NiFe] hydrogenase diaphorase subunit
MTAIPRPKVPLPSDDKRWRIVDGTARRNGLNRHALIETLHTVQEAFGFIDDDALRFVAKRLRVPLSSAYGVATFYHFFSLKPKGKHTCVVCQGTACYIKGAPKLVDAMDVKLHIKPGETTEDGEVSLMSARCVGACGLAPAVVYDGEVAGKVTPDNMIEKIEGWVPNDA